jgi:hypothetical protein
MLSIRAAYLDLSIVVRRQPKWEPWGARQCNANADGRAFRYLGLRCKIGRIVARQQRAMIRIFLGYSSGVERLQPRPRVTQRMTGLRALHGFRAVRPIA